MTTLRTLRFHEYGEPASVLRLDRIDVPSPPAGRIRAVVHACGLNPADWALCRGLFPGILPRGIGLEVSGIVDALGEGVTDVAKGDRVVGTADFAGGTSAGASDRAIMDHWAKVPAGLDLVQVAAVPTVSMTAFGGLEALRVTAGQVVLIHGAGTMVGFAAVQLALGRGARVIATAGETYAGRLRARGAQVTSYGEGMVERVREIAGGPVELALDTGPVSGVLPDLVRIVGGDPRHVFTLVDFAAAAQLGARHPFGEGENAKMPYDVLGELIQRAAEGKLTIPIARTFALEDWREALDLSQSGHARGKLVLLPGGAAS